MSAELLPCPFCGNDGVFLDNYRNRWTVGCTNMECAAFSGFYQVYDNQQIAASLWNTRTPDLSFLDKPEVLEAVAIDIRNTELEARINPHEYIDGSKALAKAAIAAIKRMAKEGK